MINTRLVKCINLFVMSFKKKYSELMFCCVPSHIGKRGNEKTAYEPVYYFSSWKSDWNGAVADKLHSVKPVLGDWQSSYRRCMKDEVVLCRGRIGHTHLTHSYILRKDPHLNVCIVSVF